MRRPVRDYCLFTKTTAITPRIPPKSGYPLCYEQMSKFRCDWFVSGKDIEGQYTEYGPFPSYDAARSFAGRT
jgi:hypothetical protein